MDKGRNIKRNTKKKDSQQVRKEKVKEQGFKMMEARDSHDINASAQSKSEAKCHNCLAAQPSFRRTFSEQAWAALKQWDEVSEETRHQPICSDCYEELRDVLIERSEEIEANFPESPSESKSHRAAG